MFLIYYFLVVTIICFKKTSSASSLITSCKINDKKCILESTNDVWQHLVSGDQSLGIESLDPSQHDLIEGNLSIIKYRFYDTTITGMKECKISDVQVNSDVSMVHAQLECPTVTLNGRYDVNGRLIILPVEGEGTYDLKTGLYKVDMDCEVKKTQGKDGKTHLHIKNYKLKPEALAPIEFDFKNLFNGQKDLSDAVHNFAHQSWKEVADLVQDPVWYAALKKVITNANIFLKQVPLEDMTAN